MEFALLFTRGVKLEVPVTPVEAMACSLDKHMLILRIPMSSHPQRGHGAV